jgi:Tfp pilus assembly protein PilF
MVSAVSGLASHVVSAATPATFAIVRALRATVSTRPRQRTRPAAFIAAGILLTTLAVFLPALDNHFVEWDDSTLFTKNEHYRGLGWTQLRWMLTSTSMGHYVPVTWLTHGADYLLWGMDPAGYHFVNIVLHSANAACFFFVALRLLGAAIPGNAIVVHLGAAIAALFFAVHPLRVESVAWVTERRDVLSGLFFLLTVLLYLQASELAGSPRVRRHALAAVCYLFAVLSKSMVMTLPAILILLDVYPLRRLGWPPRRWPARDTWLEKLPYLALGAVAAMLGYWAQAANSFITPLASVPWSARPALVAYSLWFYVSKTVVPLDLSALYEMPRHVDILAPAFAIPAIAITTLTIALVLLRCRWPAGLTVWIAYGTILSPVIGIVHSGFQLAHDRYSYLSCLGFALLIGAAGGRLVGSPSRLIRPAFARVATAVLTGWVISLAAMTWQQVHVWRDTDTLWRHALESQPDCTVCLYNLGSVLYNSGHPGIARAHFERVAAVRADRGRVIAHLGLVNAALGDLPRAAEAYRAFLTRSPNDVEARSNLGLVLASLGHHQDALRELLWAVNLEPDNAALHANAALVLLDLDARQEAFRRARRAVELQPDLPHARLAVGLAHVAMSNRGAAERELRILQFLDPTLAGVLGAAMIETW